MKNSQEYNSKIPFFLINFSTNTVILEFCLSNKDVLPLLKRACSHCVKDDIAKDKHVMKVFCGSLKEEVDILKTNHGFHIQQWS